MSTRAAKRGTSAEAGSLESKRSKPDNENVPWYNVFTKGDPEYNDYMANEWGFEKHGTIPLFEKICLEGAQSGLSWRTILLKRAAYRRTFHGFDPERVAQMTPHDVDAIVAQQAENPKDIIVRHRGKVEAVIGNAKSLLAMDEDFDQFLWGFVDGKPILNRWNGSMADAATKSPESEAMSKGLKKRGFRFVGPTTCYALMQSVGMVIDHPKDSPEWLEAKKRLEAREGGYQER